MSDSECAALKRRWDDSRFTIALSMAAWIGSSVTTSSWPNSGPPCSHAKTTSASMLILGADVGSEVVQLRVQPPACIAHALHTDGHRQGAQRASPCEQVDAERRELRTPAFVVDPDDRQMFDAL